jgi:hypothetical protein
MSIGHESHTSRLSTPTEFWSTTSLPRSIFAINGLTSNVIQDVMRPAYKQICDPNIDEPDGRRNVD